MKLRLYHDTRKKFRFCVDAWTIYVPYPKWLRKERYDAKGIYLGCSPTLYQRDKAGDTSNLAYCKIPQSSR